MLIGAEAAVLGREEGRAGRFLGRSWIAVLSAILAAQVARADAVPPTAFDSPDFLPNDSRLNPWVSPLRSCGGPPGGCNVTVHMGFINTDYACTITPSSGAVAERDQTLTPATDVTRNVLGWIDGAASPASVRILFGGGRDSEASIRDLLPNTTGIAEVEKGKHGKRWRNPRTHAKVLQVDDGGGRFVTTHGSLNLQTVGLTCKANDTLRFVERAPNLYAYFLALAEAAGSGSGKGRFPGRSGTKDSSGTGLPPVRIGGYRVWFYAGRGNEFVGGVGGADQEAWPTYLNPPLPGQHAPGSVNWFDAVIVDAARQLRQGRTVRLSVAMFEIGQEAAFVDNLWKFVGEGFAGMVTEDRTSDARVASPFPGNLDVRFLWQFQSLRDEGSTTWANLNRTPSLARSDPATGATYRLASAGIWTPRDGSGNPVHPTTPQDMHVKFMLMDVVGHESERRIYVTSSNLDTPELGSGKLWQVGTVVGEYPGTGTWSGTRASGPSLWQAYQKYFDMLWTGRDGQPAAGQIAFFERIRAEHLRGGMNWIETLPSGNARDPSIAGEGIDAFFFPVPLTATPAAGGGPAR